MTTKKKASAKRYMLLTKDSLSGESSAHLCVIGSAPSYIYEEPPKDILWLIENEYWEIDRILQEQIGGIFRKKYRYVFILKK